MTCRRRLTITKIVPDERSNSLIVVANQRAYDWLAVLVHKLDIAPEASVRGAAQDRFHIYNCANANCDELAATLSAITGVQVVGSLSHRRPASRKFHSPDGRRPGSEPSQSERAHVRG